ncbi:TonB-dependent receptor domain-containing protein [Pedobacter sp. AW31-3R]|uniref:TonB-dependent receptor domain-containing protein n=1 Tax=Pedobacter sp. AW31-3R TaxID=3445781 RepID=UPI003FA050C8
MKFILSSLFIAFFFLTLHAQEKAADGKISGKIIDAVSKLPVDYATVNVYVQGGTTAIRVVSSDPQGNFLITGLSYGTYRMVIGFVGYQPYIAEHVSLSLQQRKIVVSDILLVPTEENLKAVQITAKIPAVQNKIDKLVYDPVNDLSAQGGTAIDVLKKVPTLTVDINGNVELLGSPGINFLINGKPSSIFGSSVTEALASIPASQIKNIEVISNPGAKYDAQGTAGVINIILKDNNISGINGTVNLSAGSRLNNGSFNLNAKKKNFGISTFFSGNAQLNTTSLNSKQLSNAEGIELLDQHGSSRIKRNGYQSGISGEWNISPQDNVTASIGYSQFSNNSADLASQLQTSFDSNNQSSSVYSNRDAENSAHANNLQWSLGYRKKFKKENQELSFLYQSNIDHNNAAYRQFQHYEDPLVAGSGTSSSSPGKVKETGLEFNYAQPLGKDFSLETGGRAFFKTISSLVNAQRYDGPSQDYLPDPSQSYHFRYDRNIFAGYLSASFKVFDFLAVKAGARYEYTVNHTDFANTVIPNYGALSPSFVISHQLDDSQSLKLSYSRRIERPDYDELNPFVNRSDPYNLSAGNPMLRPELGNNFEIGYSKSFKNGTSLNLTSFLRHNGDDIKSYTDFYPTYPEGELTYENVTLTRRINTGGENKIGGNLYVNLPLSSKLSLRTNVLIYHKSIAFDYNGLNQDAGGMEYRMNLNVAYEFPKNLSAEIFGNYNTPKVGVQGRGNSFLFYTLALRKQFLNRNASIGLSATDPFNQYINQGSTISQSGNKQYTLRKVPYRSFGITFSYKFGNLKFSHKNEVKEEPNIPQEL